MEDNSNRPEPGGLRPDPEPKSEHEESQEPELPPPPTPEQAERAERLIRDANIARIRKQRQEMDRLLNEALEVAPGSALVLEAVADDLLLRGQRRRAQELYAQAIRLSPGNVSLERKHAECVFASAGLNDPAALMGGALTESYASAKSGMILSFIIPGLGQIVMGEVKRGAIMLSGVVVGWVIALLIPDGVSSFMGLLGLARNPPPFQPLVLLPLSLAACFHLWAIVDMFSRARVEQFRSKPVERPRPPVDMPFE
ncbi:MAG TPA: hypothetical protein PLO61_09105 [Fimbriimonadaceae bacterium]|nr:hypothetical protein [Fimbriimonadaceae bacterium]HRJ33646.1 hypothetical protein [Fimbriimonadaceae bacterium]